MLNLYVTGAFFVIVILVVEFFIDFRYYRRGRSTSDTVVYSSHERVHDDDLEKKIYWYN